MSASYEIITYHPRFKEQLAQLQRHLWGGGIALNTAYLEWKYEQNPYFEEPLLYLAVSGGRVIGMRGMFGSCWEVGSPATSVRVPSADDLVIAPDHRNRGVFAQIMRAVFDDLAARGYECAFTLSPGPVTLAASLASGWRAIGSMRPAHRRGPEAPPWRLTVRVDKLPVLWRYARALAPVQRWWERRPFEDLDRGFTLHRTGATPTVENH